MKKTLQISNIIAAVLTVSIGYLSNSGIFNGNTMADISAKYQTLFTPAGYAFSIWGLIYLGILGFAIYYGRSIFKPVSDEDNSLAEVGWWFVISCAANILWVVAWPFDYILISVLLMTVLFFSLLKIVVKSKMELYNPPLKKFIFLWWPFCIYAGWVSVALLANIAAYLSKIEWSGFGISEVIWTIILIFIAAFLHIFMIWNRNMREFALVGVWSFIAIAVANQNENTEVMRTALIAAGIVFINIAIHGYQNRKSNPFVNLNGNPHEK